MFKLLRRKSTEAHIDNLQIALSSGMVDFQLLRKSILKKAASYSMVPDLDTVSRNDANRSFFKRIIETISYMESESLAEQKHLCRSEMGFGKKLSVSEICANIFFALFDQAGLAIPKKSNSEDASWLSTKDGFLLSDVVGAISQVCAGVVTSQDMEELYAH